MIQLNKQFRMGGREILTPKDFCNCYSPTDLLRCRKMAAGFVRHQMAGLSPWHEYHAEVLYKAVFQWEILTEDKQEFNEFHGLMETEPVDMAEFYLNVRGIWRSMENSVRWISSECDALKNIVQVQKRTPFLEVLNSLWSRVQGTDLKGEEREQVFMILSAGYFLSRKGLDDLEECPISAKEIQLAFRGERMEETVGPQITADGLVFKASTTPYELPKSKITSTGFFVHTIEVKKIMAVQAVDGATDIPVKLKLGEELAEIMPGDYRYASFVNGEWIRIFPVRKEHDGVVMERKGNVIFVTHNDQVTQINCSKKEILDFDVDSEGNYILLEPKYADYSHFTQRQGMVDQLPTQNIVEVTIQKNQVYLLDKRGAMFENGELQKQYPTSLIYCL